MTTSPSTYAKRAVSGSDSDSAAFDRPEALGGGTHVGKARSMNKMIPVSLSNSLGRLSFAGFGEGIASAKPSRAQSEGSSELRSAVQVPR